MFWPGPEDSHEAEEALQSVSARREATIRRHSASVSELIAANMRNLPESTGNRNLGYPDDAAIRHVFSMVSRDKHAIVTDVAILQRFCCEAPMTQRVLT